MPTQAGRENWTKRDDVALALFLAWLPSHLRGQNLADAVPDSVAKANVNHAFKLADIFMTVQRGAAPS
jgi:hypothetical protein